MRSNRVLICKRLGREQIADVLRFLGDYVSSLEVDEVGSDAMTKLLKCQADGDSSYGVECYQADALRGFANLDRELIGVPIEALVENVHMVYV